MDHMLPGMRPRLAAVSVSLEWADLADQAGISMRSRLRLLAARVVQPEQAAQAMLEACLPTMQLRASLQIHMRQGTLHRPPVMGVTAELVESVETVPVPWPAQTMSVVREAPEAQAAWAVQAMPEDLSVTIRIP